MRYEQATETDDLNISTSVKQVKQDTLPFMSYVQEIKSEVFCNVILCLTIILEVPLGQQ